MLIFKCVLMFLLYLVTYYLYGVFYNIITRRKEKDFTTSFVAGMFLYCCFFMIYALPMKYHKTPLHITALIWEIIWGVSLVLIAFFCRKKVLEPAKSLLEYIKDNKLNSLLFGLFNIGQIGFIEIFGRWSTSNNSAEYIAYVTTSMYTDQSGTTNPWTGYPLSSFDMRTFTQTFLDHSAVISTIFKVHPLMEIRNVTPALFLLVGNLLIFLIARSIYKESAAKQWLFYTVYQAALITTCTSVLMHGYYVLYRVYEGKNAYSALMVPLLFYVIWKLYENPRDVRTLLFGMLCVAGSFHYTGIALFSAPVTALGLLPSAFSKKNWWRALLNIVLLSLPSAIYAVYYFGVMYGKISLKI